MSQVETTAIPFLDLVGPHAELREELHDVFDKALGGAAFIGGPAVQGFETEFADFCGARHCVGVGSGTDALRFALMAAGVGAGDIAITVPNTFIATTEAISQCGAHPVFVDVDERTYNLDAAQLGAYIEKNCEFDARKGVLLDRRSGDRVKAIVPVHLYGQMADMDPILELAERYNLIVIEDACQAHGAEYFSRRENRWRRAGSVGKAAAFSFYPGKNLGACGEGGAVTTDDAEVAQRIRMLRDHGQAQKYHHELEGFNGRLDAIQAGILRVKLRCLQAWNEKRREAARRYEELLRDCPGVILPCEPDWSKGVFHLYVVRVSDREKFMRHLNAAAIGTGIHYPIPLHIQKAYAHLNHREGDFPVAEGVAPEIVSLPMFPGITCEQQARVADEVRAYIRLNS